MHILFLFSDFEAIAQYCARYTSSMPVILLLGFFTSTAMTRWFMAQTNIPGTGRPISVFCISLKETAPEVIFYYYFFTSAPPFHLINLNKIIIERKC